MASEISVTFGPGTIGPNETFDRIAGVFADVETQCTRFNESSDLMRANAAGEDSIAVGRYCYDALRAAERAHAMTGGAFDPRVLGALRELGYTRSLPFASGQVRVARHAAAPAPPPAASGPWQPVFEPVTGTVRIGPVPVDLGGIGKGLAVRWGLATAARDSPCVLIEAGGDCHARGSGPEGTGWRLGVEDPRGGADPLAVLAVTDAACATSSIRLRRWRADDKLVHHLIDPRTGAPGGDGLLAVTVVADDCADAEVWSKVLFLHGRAGIADAARLRGLAALWVDTEGTLGASAAMLPLVVWRAHE